MNIRKTQETAKRPMKVFESSSHLDEKTQVRQYVCQFKSTKAAECLTS